VDDIEFEPETDDAVTRADDFSYPALRHSQDRMLRGTDDVVGMYPLVDDSRQSRPPVQRTAGVVQDITWKEADFSFVAQRMLIASSTWT
jgi:hypothetical protein